VQVMNQLKQIGEFLKKNRTVIYVILGLALMLQICSRGASTPGTTTTTQGVEEVITDSIQGMEAPTNEPSHSNDINSLMIMIGLVLAFFVAKRYGYLEKLFPKVVIVKLSFAKQRSTGKLIAQVVLINHKKEAINFENPVLIFHKGSKKREFVIKNMGGVNYFPLTLVSGVGHKFNVDIQKFYDNVEGLSQFKNISVSFKTTVGKTHTSMKWPTWMVTKKIG